MNLATIGEPERSEFADRGNFDDFFRRERRAASEVAFLMLCPQSSAEDVIQDAFCKVLERWNSLDNPSAYLRVVIINGCRHLHRRASVARRFAPFLRPTNSSQVDTQEYVQDILNSLTPRRRAVIVLRFYCSLSVPEIASVLHISEGTVKSTLHRSLAALQEVLR